MYVLGASKKLKFYQIEHFFETPCIYIPVEYYVVGDNMHII